MTFDQKGIYTKQARAKRAKWITAMQDAVGVPEDYRKGFAKGVDPCRQAEIWDWLWLEMMTRFNLCSACTEHVDSAEHIEDCPTWSVQP